ncbi:MULTISPECIES: hypothetical protein [unclassified Bradyrhizobium]
MTDEFTEAILAVLDLDMIIGSPLVALHVDDPAIRDASSVQNAEAESECIADERAPALGDRWRISRCRCSYRQEKGNPVDIRQHFSSKRGFRNGSLYTPAPDAPLDVPPCQPALLRENARGRQRPPARRDDLAQLRTGDGAIGIGVEGGADRLQ